MDLLDRSTIIWIVGALVLSIVGYIAVDWHSLLALLRSGDARILAAGIYGVFTVAGILLSTGLSIIIKWRASVSERRRLAAALLVEVIGNSRAVVSCGLALRAVRSHQTRISEHELNLLLPSAAVVYPAVADKILLFKPEDTMALTQFYASVDRASRMSRTLLDKHGGTVEVVRGSFLEFDKVVSPSLAPDLSVVAAEIAWSSAARVGLRTILSLRRLITSRELGMETETFEAVVEKLRQFAETGDNARQATRGGASGSD